MALNQHVASKINYMVIDLLAFTLPGTTTSDRVKEIHKQFFETIVKEWEKK